MRSILSATLYFACTGYLLRFARLSSYLIPLTIQQVRLGISGVLLKSSRVFRSFFSQGSHTDSLTFSITTGGGERHYLSGFHCRSVEPLFRRETRVRLMSKQTDRHVASSPPNRYPTHRCRALPLAFPFTAQPSADDARHQAPPVRALLAREECGTTRADAAGSCRRQNSPA